MKSPDESVRFSSKNASSLGRFPGFPTRIHGKSTLSHRVEASLLQKALLKALRQMNQRVVDTLISIADRPGYFEGEMGYEVGIAEGECFNYLDDSEEKRVIDLVAERGPLPSLDTLIIVKYSVKNGRKHSLRFDWYLARLFFFPGEMEIHLFHEKGIRRVNPDELIAHVVDALNKELKVEDFPEVKISNMQTF